MPPFPKARYLIIAVLLVLPAVLAFASLREKSWTWDEPIYLAGGHYLVKTGNFRNQAISYHPPLAFYLNSVGLVGLQLPDALFPPSTTDHDWEVGMQVAFRSGYDPETIRWRARLPFVLLTPLLGFVVYRWSRDLWGWRGGLLSLALVAFDPNLLAHTRLVATDYLFTLMLVVTLYVSWLLLRHGRWWRVAATGLALGATFLAKFTAIILFPVAALGAVWAFRPKPRDGWPAWPARRVIAAGFLIILIGLFVLWAGYLFQYGVALPNPADRALVAAMEPKSGIEGMYQRLYGSEVRIPAVSYFMGFFSQYAHGSGGHSNYLLGQVSDRGWAWYFPVAVAVKTPVPILLGWIVGLVAALRQPARRRDVAWLLSAPIVLLILSTRSHINIGVRHVLILYPLMAVVAGAAAYWLKRRSSQIIGGLCGLWLLISVLRVYPDYLTYFNEFAGGPRNGYHVLVDSNLDWGQDLDALFATAELNNWLPMQVQYFGPPRSLEFSPPGFSPMQTPCTPANGYVAVSMTNRVGAYMPGGAQCFSWLDGREPLAVVHNTIAVYSIPETGTDAGSS